MKKKSTLQAFVKPQSYGVFLSFFLYLTPLNAQRTGFVLPEHPQYYCVTITAFQIALTKKGYPLKADGVFGKKTRKTFIKFANDKGLPTGNLWGHFSDAFPALGFEPCTQ